MASVPSLQCHGESAMNLQGIFPQTLSDWLFMSASYALVALGFVMVTHPYETGAVITKAVVSVVEVVS